MHRKTVLTLLATILFGACIAKAEAGDFDQPAKFDIDAQPLDTALLRFSEQAGIQVLVPTVSINGIKTSGIHGKHIAERALATLLKDSGLTYKQINARTIAIRSSDKQTSAAQSALNLAQVEGQSEMQKAENPSSSDNQSIPSGETSGSGENKIQEIVVTAQKREERLQEVPISIVVMGADEMLKRNITSLDDLSSAVPGLFVQNNGTTFHQIQMRGVSNIFGSGALVGMYIDEASVTTGPPGYEQIDVRTYDLERVEVLRGPQGTLYGESSVGGTIRFITKKPVLDHFAMNADIAALFTEDGEPGGRIQGALNMPLIESELGLRIAGTFDRQGGWIDQPAAAKKDFNEQNLMNVRVNGLWQPVPQFSVNATAIIHRNDAPHNAGEDAEGNFTQAFNLTTTPRANDDYDLYNLALTYDFPAVRVLSTTSYIDQDKEAQAIGYKRQFTPPGVPKIHLYFDSRESTTDILSEELRLTSIGSGPWQWTVGGFYRNSRSGGLGGPRVGLASPPGTPLPNPPLSRQSFSSESFAVFGDASYKLTDRLTLGTGLRYFEDDREDRVSGQNSTFDSITPRVYAQYELTNHVNTYASAAEGFRSGGFNPGALQPDYDPESVWTYELGTKMSVLDDRLRADVAIFHSDYSEYQTIGIQPENLAAGLITSNTGDAQIRGIEGGLTLRPTDQWSLSFSGTYIDTEFEKINTISSSHAVGDPLDAVPEYGYSVSVERDFDWNGKAGWARLDYNEQGRMSFRVRTIGPWYFDESGIINMLNFNARLRWNDNLSLGVFAQNLLNDHDFVGPFGIEENAARSRPRTFGIEFGITF